ncbi:MAG: hypothetical protein KGJ59_01335 [Bacteroidota bacterium]|nr:hypothetical protein [Bacteroidota bacterium]
MDPHQHENMNAPPSPLHELRDANVKNLWLIGGGLFAGVLVVLAVLAGVFAFYTHHTTAPDTKASTFIAPDNTAPGPHIQADPHADLLKLRASEDSVLYRYGWVRKDAGIAHVPISVAMKMALKKGFPQKQMDSASKTKSVSDVKAGQ